MNGYGKYLLIYAVIFLFPCRSPVRGAEFGGGARVETDSFVVMAYDLELARKVGRDIERRRGEISRALGLANIGTWRPKCRVYIYENWTAYRRDSGGRDWSGGFAQRLVQEKDSAGRHDYDDRVVRAVFMFEKDSYGELMSVLSHELAHVIFRDAMGASPAIPLWLDEGVAVYNATGGPDDYRKLVKKEVKKGGSIPLSILFSEKGYPAEKKLFYAESASVVDMMIDTFGNVAFLVFARLVSDGIPPSDALNAAYSSFTGSVDEFEEKWGQYVIDSY